MQPIVNGVDPSFQQENRQCYTSAKEVETNTSFFPIGYCRDLTAKEIECLKHLANLPEYQYNGKPSLSKLVVKVYGSKNVDTLNKVKEILLK
jgi:hypothetical protein